MLRFLCCKKTGVKAAAGSGESEETESARLNGLMPQCRLRRVRCGFRPALIDRPARFLQSHFLKLQSAVGDQKARSHPCRPMGGSIEAHS